MKNLSKILKYSTALLAFSFGTSIANAQTPSNCQQAPGCTDMGYTMSAADCPDGGIKCPWDTSKMLCLSSIEATGCQIGDILFNDLSCGSSVAPPKVPIGVVFNPDKKLAIALEKSNLAWAGSSVKSYNLTALKDCTDSNSVASCSPDGKSNTAKIILSSGINDNYPAAKYCYQYATSGTNPGEWFMPSMSDLMDLYENDAKVNETMQRLNATAVTSDIWSSNEQGAEHAWMVSYDMRRKTYYLKSTALQARAVINYGNTSPDRCITINNELQKIDNDYGNCQSIDCAWADQACYDQCTQKYSPLMLDKANELASCLTSDGNIDCAAMNVTVPANATCTGSNTNCPGICTEWSCNSGYVKEGYTCQKCSYTLGSCPARAASCDSCVNSSGVTKYKITECKDGLVLNGQQCQSPNL